MSHHNQQRQQRPTNTSSPPRLAPPSNPVPATAGTQPIVGPTHQVHPQGGQAQVPGPHAPAQMSGPHALAPSQRLATPAQMSGPHALAPSQRLATPAQMSGPHALAPSQRLATPAQMSGPHALAPTQRPHAPAQMSGPHALAPTPLKVPYVKTERHAFLDLLQRMAMQRHLFPLAAYGNFRTAIRRLINIEDQFSDNSAPTPRAMFDTFVGALNPLVSWDSINEQNVLGAIVLSANFDKILLERPHEIGNLPYVNGGDGVPTLLNRLAWMTGLDWFDLQARIHASSYLQENVIDSNNVINRKRYFYLFGVREGPVMESAWFNLATIKENPDVEEEAKKFICDMRLMDP